MVYSASAIEATVRHHDAQFFLKRQAIYALVALVAMWLVSRIDYRRLKALTYPILARRHGHAARAASPASGTRPATPTAGSPSGPIHIQPSETAKLGIVLWLAYSLSKKAERVKSFAVGFLPHLLVVGVLDAPLPEAARLRQRRRAPLPHLHAPLRGRRARPVHRRAHHAHGARRRRPRALQRLPLRALPRLDRHGRASGATSPTSRSSR